MISLATLIFAAGLVFLSLEGTLQAAALFGLAYLLIAYA